MASPENAAEKKQSGQDGKPQSHPNVRVLEGLLNTKAARNTKKKTLRLRARHVVIITGFVATTIIPTAAASFYMAFVAVDQYQSSTSFSVRSISNSAMTSDILGMFTQSSATSTVSDSYILSDYILSERMVAELDAKFGFENIYAVRGQDIYYGIAAGTPIEQKVDYWHSMVEVNFDHSSGIMQLKIKAFDPEQARQITNFVLANCESLINDLSNAATEEALRAAHVEIALAEKRLADARIAMRKFRDESQEVDPVEGAKIATQMVGEMEQQLAKLNAAIATARQQMGEDTPRIRVLKAQIASLEAQIEQERQRLGSGTSSDAAMSSSGASPEGQAVSDKLLIYEGLETEREFAERTYTVALASLEKARIEATGKQRYLATFIEPTLSEEAQYPKRTLNVLLVFLAGLFLWGMVTLSYYNIRDRA